MILVLGIISCKKSSDEVTLSRSITQVINLGGKWTNAIGYITFSNDSIYNWYTPGSDMNYYTYIVEGSNLVMYHFKETNPTGTTYPNDTIIHEITISNDTLYFDGYFKGKRQ